MTLKKMSEDRMSITNYGQGIEEYKRKIEAEKEEKYKKE